jgi:hypothetical protein
MTELYDQIKKQAVKGLNVRVENPKKVSEPGSDGFQTSYQIGDQIEFTLYARNDNPFELSVLHFHIHQLTAVELEENPVKAEIQELPAGDEKPIVTLRGRVIGNPNDVTSPWTQLDSLCRVKVKGTILLKPIQFEDVEVETINIPDS